MINDKFTTITEDQRIIDQSTGLNYYLWLNVTNKITANLQTNTISINSLRDYLKILTKIPIKLLNTIKILVKILFKILSEIMLPEGLTV